MDDYGAPVTEDRPEPRPVMPSRRTLVRYGGPAGRTVGALPASSAPKSAVRPEPKHDDPHERPGGKVQPRHVRNVRAWALPRASDSAASRRTSRRSTVAPSSRSQSASWRRDPSSGSCECPFRHRDARVRVERGAHLGGRAIESRADRPVARRAQWPSRRATGPGSGTEPARPDAPERCSGRHARADRARPHRRTDLGAPEPRPKVAPRSHRSCGVGAPPRVRSARRADRSRRRIDRGRAGAAIPSTSRRAFAGQRPLRGRCHARSDARRDQPITDLNCQLLVGIAIAVLRSLDQRSICHTPLPTPQRHGRTLPLTSIEDRNARIPPSSGRCRGRRRRDSTRFDCRHIGRVVPGVLVRVGLGEVGGRAVEDVAAAEVGGDGHRVTGAGMRPGQGPGADGAI